MKKTLTVNLGGTVYHIDEDAYKLLDTYLSNLRIHFCREEGAEEIVHDMELRISELFTDRLRDGKQVITIEDPVEIVSPDLLQFQLNEVIGNTYDSLIKLSLRHRPDVLIIGEIRDKETARAVIRASLTGVTVLSTIHAKSIAGVYERLLDLGVDKSELDNALQGIAYMRLIKGGGVIDFARENFQNHSSTNWNQQLEGLVKQGCLTERDIQGEKIKD